MVTIEKSGLIYIKNKKLLCVREKGKNVYYFPGGEREKKETDEETLIREIKEELNVEIVPENLKFINTFKAQAYGKPKGTILKMTCYTGDFKGEMIPNSEIEELAWLTYKDREGATPMMQIVLDWLKEKGLID